MTCQSLTPIPTYCCKLSVISYTLMGNMPPVMTKYNVTFILWSKHLSAGSLNRRYLNYSYYWIQNLLCQEPGPDQRSFILCDLCQSQPIYLLYNWMLLQGRSSKVFSIHLFSGFGQAMGTGIKVGDKSWSFWGWLEATGSDHKVERCCSPGQTC